MVIRREDRQFSQCLGANVSSGSELPIGCGCAARARLDMNIQSCNRSIYPKKFIVAVWGSPFLSAHKTLLLLDALQKGDCVAGEAQKSSPTFRSA
jgi:hypothetical protein